MICRQLSDSSAGLRTALNVVVAYEQRGAAMLTHMLGSSYSVHDLMAYALAALGIAATGFSKSLKAARFPLIGLFALSVVAERALMHSFHHMLQVDPTGEVNRCAGSLLFSRVTGGCSSSACCLMLPHLLMQKIVRMSVVHKSKIHLSFIIRLSSVE